MNKLLGRQERRVNRTDNRRASKNVHHARTVAHHPPLKPRTTPHKSATDNTFLSGPYPYVYALFAHAFMRADTSGKHCVCSV
jgi:hypothetical protein